MLTNAQRRALKWARGAAQIGLRDGTIEQSIDLGLSGAALDAVIAALDRRGYVEGDYARITPKGLAALAEAEAARKAAR
jgi:DNA-binding MarR family transcriptional regulator